MKVLIIEDNPIVLKVLKKLVKDFASFEAVYATTMAQAAQAIDRFQHEIFASIADLNLPDAPSGEVVDLLIANNIPTIVLTGSFSDEKRETLFRIGIVDYVVKESVYSYQYSIQLIDRLDKNRNIEVLVVEDSSSTRTHISKLLQRQLFKVHEAANGVEALETLKKNPNIKLMITDYHMPEMDGFELIYQVRRKLDKSNLIIIGLSAEGHPSLSARFIKNGANDFLKKPFIPEEFHCRINHCLAEKELLAKVEDSANRDYLTGLYNRRYFYSESNRIIQQRTHNEDSLSCCVIDVDYFKVCNDTYGHDVGDMVLVQLANILKEFFGDYIIARLGGEEFAVLLQGISLPDAISQIDQARILVTRTPITIKDDAINITFSAGVAAYKNSLDKMLKEADNGLYAAKKAGRNLVLEGNPDFS